MAVNQATHFMGWSCLSFSHSGYCRVGINRIELVGEFSVLPDRTDSGYSSNRRPKCPVAARHFPLDRTTAEKKIAQAESIASWKQKQKTMTFSATVGTGCPAQC